MSATGHWLKKGWGVLVGALLLLTLASDALAGMYRQRDSLLDPAMFRIDEPKFMGVRFDGETLLRDGQGRVFKFQEMVGKPLILVFSYFTCDGACSTVNNSLKELLRPIERSRIGEDFQVLTVSFDQYDTVETLGSFAKALDLPPEWNQGWRLALLENKDTIHDVTGKVGFKYYWQAQDKTFYHQNVMIFLSSEGRVVRYLYAGSNTPKDVELALLDARQNQFRPSQVIDLMVSLCYSYNFKEGRYTYNLPAFIGGGSFLFGIGLLVGSLVLYRKKHSG
ncbi:MAG: SCO family protein [Magnetococcales bacterium]|nr:SCO family protein [Magnetococcales bacterium]